MIGNNDKMIKSMAVVLLGSQEMHCLTCSNPVKNMGLNTYKKGYEGTRGCDGNCSHREEIDTAEKVIEWFEINSIDFQD